MNNQQTPAEFREWNELSATEPLRQGDILKRQGDDIGLWKKWLVVITADCDLAYSKYGGSLSCVSILDHEQYLAMFRAEKICSDEEKSIVNKIVSAVTGQDRESSPFHGTEVSRISQERWKSWILEGPNKNIFDVIDVDDLLAKELASYFDAYRGLVAAKETSDLSAKILAIAKAKTAKNSKMAEQKAIDSVVKDLSETLKRLPGDAMFIGSLAPDANDGYVAYLRRIHEIDEHQVATHVRLYTEPTDYIRMGRLAAPYVYALTQQVGNVFSSIGLPEHYEEYRDQTAMRFAELQKETG